MSKSRIVSSLGILGRWHLFADGHRKMVGGPFGVRLTGAVLIENVADGRRGESVSKGILSCFRAEKIRLRLSIMGSTIGD